MPNFTFYKVYIADGFKEDCEELIQECVQLETLNFKTFTNVWKEMNFPCIYQGRQTGAEIAELSEEVIHIAKSFMLKDASNFQESKAGIYLVYALLTQQPYQNFAWLRLTPDDIPAIKRIEAVARREKQNDVLYIMGKILIRHTQYHATERERGFENTLKKYMDGCTSLDNNGFRPQGVFHQQHEELDLIKDLGVISRRYATVRNSVADKYKFGHNIKYINEGLPAELHSSLKNLMNGFHDADPDPHPEHYTSVQSIKHKAMVTTVNPMAHLMSAEERKVKGSPHKGSLHKSDIKSKPGKIKTGSPTKTYSSLKRKLPSTKLKKSKCFSTDVDSDEELDIKAFGKVTKKLKKTRRHKSEIDSNLSDDWVSKVSDEDTIDMEDSDDSNRIEVEKEKGSNKKKQAVCSKVAEQYCEINKVPEKKAALALDKEKGIQKHKLPPSLSKLGENYCEIEILDYAANDEVSVEDAITDMFKAVGPSKEQGSSKDNKNDNTKCNNEPNVPIKIQPKVKIKLKKAGIIPNSYDD